MRRQRSALACLCSGLFEFGARPIVEFERRNEPVDRVPVRRLAIAAFEGADRLDADQRTVRERLLRQAGRNAEPFQEARERRLAGVAGDGDYVVLRAHYRQLCDPSV